MNKIKLKKKKSNERPSLVTLTFDNKFRGALSLAKRVDRDHLVFATVFWLYAENVQGANAKRVGDVIVFVRVDADVIQVPGHSWRGTSADGTRHVELVSFRWSVDLKRHQDRGGPLKAELAWNDSVWTFRNCSGRKIRKTKYNDTSTAALLCKEYF